MAQTSGKVTQASVTRSSTVFTQDNGKNINRRRRRPNFSELELEALVKAVESRSHLAEGKIFGNFETHRQAWLDVAQDVQLKTGGCVGNSVGKSTTTARTATELRLKWIDLTCRVRQKWRARLDGHNVRDYPSLQLSPLESNILTILRKTGTSRFKIANTASNRGRQPINPRFSSNSETTINVGNHPKVLPQPSSPKVVEARVNGSKSQSIQSPLDSEIVQRRLSSAEITIAPIPSIKEVNNHLSKTVINVPDELASKTKALGINSCSSSSSVLSEFPSEEDNVFNYENGWRELAVRQDQMIEVLRELLQENVRRRAVEEETLNLLKTFVSLQARSVELKEFKLGFNHQSDEFVIENVQSHATDVDDSVIHNND